MTACTGFHMCHALGGGTVCCMETLLLWKLREEYAEWERVKAPPPKKNEGKQHPPKRIKARTTTTLLYHSLLSFTLLCNLVSFDWILYFLFQVRHHTREAEEGSNTQKEEEDQAAPHRKKKEKIPPKGREEDRRRRPAKNKNKLKGTFTITFKGLYRLCSSKFFKETTVASASVIFNFFTQVLNL